jgi:hypothetical protein
MFLEMRLHRFDEKREYRASLLGTDIAEQMGQTELHEHAEVSHVLAVGAEVVAAQHSLEFLPSTSISTSEEREGSILNNVNVAARKHQVHSRWAYSLCPVSSTLSIACLVAAASNWS